VLVDDEPAHACVPKGLVSLQIRKVFHFNIGDARVGEFQAEKVQENGMVLTIRQSKQASTDNITRKELTEKLNREVEIQLHIQKKHLANQKTSNNNNNNKNNNNNNDDAGITSTAHNPNRFITAPIAYPLQVGRAPREKHVEHLVGGRGVEHKLGQLVAGIEGAV
jgi:hypothetical protein